MIAASAGSESPVVAAGAVLPGRGLAMGLGRVVGTVDREVDAGAAKATT
jgi:hypothetical protein